MHIDGRETGDGVERSREERSKSLISLSLAPVAMIPLLRERAHTAPL